MLKPPIIMIGLFIFSLGRKTSGCRRNSQFLTDKELDSPVKIFVLSYFSFPKRPFENMSMPLISEHGERSQVFVLYVNYWGGLPCTSFMLLLFPFYFLWLLAPTSMHLESHRF